MRHQYYILTDRVAVPVDDMMEWARRFQDTDARRVARTELDCGLVISTVFFGIDHAFFEGPPLLFETMIFGDYDDHDMRRYSTWAEAELGHMEMVEALTPALESVDAGAAG